MILIGLAGKKGSGKSTVAKGIASLFEGAVIESFAAPIRRFAEDCGFNLNHKEAPDDYLGASPRVFMQLCGTEFVRNMIAPDFWIRSLKRRIELASLVGSGASEKVFIIEDVRFPNEAAFIEELGGMVFYVDDQRGVDLADMHSSETMTEALCGATIINNHRITDSLGRAVQDIVYSFASFRGEGIKTKVGVILPQPIRVPEPQLFMRPRSYWDGAIVGRTWDGTPVYSRDELECLLRIDYGDVPVDEWVDAAQKDPAIAAFHVITLNPTAAYPSAVIKLN